MDNKKVKKGFFEILMYVNGTIFILSFFWLFFVSGEFGIMCARITAIVFICSCIIAFINAHILLKKEEKIGA